MDFIWNIVAACEPCNHLRNNRLPGEFLRDRLSFTRFVDDSAKKSDVIPYLKARTADGEINVFAHLEISDFAAQVIRNLDHSLPHMEMTVEQVRERKRFLSDQAARLIIERYRQSLEAAGQLPLPFDGKKPPTGSEKSNYEARHA